MSIRTVSYRAATISEMATKAASPLIVILSLPWMVQCKYPPRFDA